jgi:hypothetical protein
VVEEGRKGVDGWWRRGEREWMGGGVMLLMVNDMLLMLFIFT